jgi:uncharacterized membrane protein YuzA (DUF378 family)
MIMKAAGLIAVVLLIVGGLNWGLVGLFQFDLVAALFGAAGFMSRLVYTLVGLAAVYVAVQTVGTRGHNVPVPVR